MDFICIIIFILLISIILAIVLKINTKEVKKVAENQELDELAKKYPSNKQICKDILKKLNNEDVTIEEDNNTKNCLYIAMTNKIVIADIKDNFSRMQTIAHECLHSIQDKRIQKFNFIYSNIYLFYFVIVLVLGILKKIPNEMLFLNLFIIMGLVYYAIRIYLEDDAMLKARYLAKEYMEEKACATKEEIAKIVEGFDQINSMGIKGSSYSLLLGVLIKTLILALIFACF